MYFGVLMPFRVQLQDAIATPLLWVVYVPFLIWVLQRDSGYWARAGFMACIVEEGGNTISELRVCALRALRACVRARAPWGRAAGAGAGGACVRMGVCARGAARAVVRPAGRWRSAG